MPVGSPQYPRRRKQAFASRNAEVPGSLFGEALELLGPGKKLLQALQQGHETGWGGLEALGGPGRPCKLFLTP